MKQLELGLKLQGHLAERWKERSELLLLLIRRMWLGVVSPVRTGPSAHSRRFGPGSSTVVSSLLLTTSLLPVRGLGATRWPCDAAVVVVLHVVRRTVLVRDPASGWELPIGRLVPML